MSMPAGQVRCDGCDFSAVLPFRPITLRYRLPSGVIARPRPMRLRQPIEILYLTLMSNWHKAAPPDGHLGELDNLPTRNTQISRLAYILNKIAVPKFDRIFSALATHVRREDGESYISKDRSWMIEPTELGGGWHLEGCTRRPVKVSSAETYAFVARKQWEVETTGRLTRHWKRAVNHRGRIVRAFAVSARAGAEMHSWPAVQRIR
jgi:hypothetical protein